MDHLALEWRDPTASQCFPQLAMAPKMALPAVASRVEDKWLRAEVVSRKNAGLGYGKIAAEMTKALNINVSKATG